MGRRFPPAARCRRAATGALHPTAARTYGWRNSKPFPRRPDRQRSQQGGVVVETNLPALRSHIRTRERRDGVMADPNLTVSSESVCYIIVKAREFDSQDVVTDPDSGSNATDDLMTSVLEAHADDPTLKELQAFIAALSEEEQTDLVALMWLGRGDGTVEDWLDLRDEAQQQHNNRTPAYLLGEPLPSDFPEESLSQFGPSFAEFENHRP